MESKVEHLFHQPSCLSGAGQRFLPRHYKGADTAIKGLMVCALYFLGRVAHHHSNCEAQPLFQEKSLREIGKDGSEIAFLVFLSEIALAHR